MLTTVVALIVVLGVLVFIHEAGHFVAAKWAGIYVHRFSLGLGSPIRWLTFRKGETEYSVSWIPLGGYVKMASGEEDIGGSPLEGGQAATQVPPDRLFEAKPLWKRMIVILAGVTMNALFAWLIFSFLAAKNGRQIDPGTTVGRIDAEATSEVGQELAGIKPGSRIVTINERPVSSWNEVQDAILNSAGPELRVLFADGSADTLPIHQDALAGRARAAQALLPYRPAVIGQLVPGQPAEKAGLLPGDTIVAVDGVPIGQWYDILDQFRGRARPEVSMEVARGATRRTFTVRPEVDTLADSTGVRRPISRIGVAVAIDFRQESLSLPQAVAEGWKLTISSSTQIVRTIRGLFSGRISKREVGGPIMIGQLAGESARLGPDAFLSFMALISINLAILNLLPVPILDGGQFVFLLAEGVTRRPLPVKLRERLSMVGMVLIVLLMGLAFSNDIRRLFGG
ncbi:MAG: RIP metalloprotease RseP [Gemmatimonadales bacterium]